MSLTRALASHGLAASVEDLAAYYRALGRPVPCDPALVPPEHADAECDLADALEAIGAPVVPPRDIRQRRLTAALRKLRDPSPDAGKVTP